MRRNRGRSKRHFTIPIGIVAGFMPAVADIQKNAGSFGVLGSIQHTTAGLIGWDTVSNKWTGWTQMRAAGTPAILAGFLAHMIANKIGINRALSRARVPLIRI